MALELQHSLEESFGTKLPIELLMGMPSLNEFVSRLLDILVRAPAPVNAGTRTGNNGRSNGAERKLPADHNVEGWVSGIGITRCEKCSKHFCHSERSEESLFLFLGISQERFFALFGMKKRCWAVSTACFNRTLEKIKRKKPYSSPSSLRIRTSTPGVFFSAPENSSRFDPR